MEPKKPMEPMKPMQPMKPMEAWWPPELDDPTVSGAQNGARYAFFPDRKRLLIEREGITDTYETGEHRITGAAQDQGDGDSLVFSTASGELDLWSLRKIAGN